MLIIGLVGTSGAGKSTASNYLKKQGFYTVELSSFLKEEALKRGIQEVNKKILQDVGNDLRSKFGSDILARMALERIYKSKAEKAVVDGIRNINELLFFNKQKNFSLIGIDAEQFIRYKRIVKLRGKKWVGTFKDFQQIETRENTLGNKNIGLRVRDCLKEAKVILINNRTVDIFYMKINNMIKKLK